MPVNNKSELQNSRINDENSLEYKSLKGGDPWLSLHNNTELIKTDEVVW